MSSYSGSGILLLEAQWRPKYHLNPPGAYKKSEVKKYTGLEHFFVGKHQIIGESKLYVKIKKDGNSIIESFLCTWNPPGSFSTPSDYHDTFY